MLFTVNCYQLLLSCMYDSELSDLQQREADSYADDMARADYEAEMEAYGAAEAQAKAERQEQEKAESEGNL